MTKGKNKKKGSKKKPQKTMKEKKQEKRDKKNKRNNFVQHTLYEVIRDEVKRWDFGEDRKESSSSKSKTSKISEQGSYPTGDKFYVNCADCDREIEFGS